MTEQWSKRMTRMKRRNHLPECKAKLAIAVLKSDKTLLTRGPRLPLSGKHQIYIPGIAGNIVGNFSTPQFRY